MEGSHLIQGLEWYCIICAEQESSPQAETSKGVYLFDLDQVTISEPQFPH